MHIPIACISISFTYLSSLLCLSSHKCPIDFFYTHLVSFSYIRLILSNRTYSIMFIVAQILVYGCAIIDILHHDTVIMLLIIPIIMILPSMQEIQQNTIKYYYSLCCSLHAIQCLIYIQFTISMFSSRVFPYQSNICIINQIFTIIDIHHNTEKSVIMITEFNSQLHYQLSKKLYQLKLFYLTLAPLVHLC